MKRAPVTLWAVAALLAVGSSDARPQEPPKEKKPPQTQAAPPSQTQPAPRAKITKKPPRPRPVVDLSGFDLLDPKQTMVVAASRITVLPEVPEVVALAPRLGKVYSTAPAFAWSYDGPDSMTYVLILRDDTYEEVFRAEVIGATRYQYPRDAPALKPEKTYVWTVEPVSPMESEGGSSPVALLIVSAQQREEIERSLAQAAGGDAYQAALARARVFTENRLWYDAVEAYTELITQYPDRAELYEERGMIYAQLEVTRRLSDDDFSRVDELRAGSTPQK